MAAAPLCIGRRDVVCVPTNWVPMPSHLTEDMMAMKQYPLHGGGAFELDVVAAGCRIGEERGQPFIGQSLTCTTRAGPSPGRAPKDGRALLMAQVTWPRLAAAGRSYFQPGPA